MGIQVEKELKLISTFNSQLKYNDIRSEKKVIEKIKDALIIFDIDFEESDIKNVKQTDKYFDTEDKHFFSNKGSLRVRITEQAARKQFFATIKTNIKTPESKALIRKEEETEEQDFDAALSHIYKYSMKYGITSKLYESVEIVNSRTIIPITSLKNTYNLCFDKYFFCVKGKRSDTFYELEIESVSSVRPNDTRIQKLQNLFAQIFEFKVNKISKYEQAVTWYNAPYVSLKNKQFVLIDIVDYSMKIPESQKATIIVLNKKIKICLEESLIAEKTIILSIGDGAILVFDETINILPFVEKICKLLSAYNESHTDDKNISIRIAIHYGPVFEYPDINDNMNYAGNGINIVARIGSKTDARTILISEDYYKRIQNFKTDESRFGDSFEIEVKHNEKIMVRKYFDCPIT